jgi:tetratricopeptide (TPR) repeat protein
MPPLRPSMPPLRPSMPPLRPSMPPSSTLGRSTPPDRPVPSNPPSAPAPRPATSPSEARRKALAHRLGRRSPPAASVQKPTAPTAEQTAMAKESLKHRYLDAKESAQRFQAQRHVDAARDALARDDLVLAAGQYKVALQYTKDPEIVRAYDDVARRAREALATTVIKQAKYQEREQQWKEAAASYERACEIRAEDAELFERAAFTRWRSGGDLHRAARYAEAAVQKNPSNAAFRVTLASVYVDAGLILRAKSELEQALKIAPADAKVKEPLAQVKKQTVYTF